MQDQCNDTEKLTMHLNDMVAVCKEISCATDAVPTAEVCRIFFQGLGVTVESQEDLSFSENDKVWDHNPGTMEYSPTLLFIILSVVLCLCASVAPSTKFYKIFHSKRVVNMAEEVIDLKKMEVAIFSSNANQSEESYKILKDYISYKKPPIRRFYFLACQYELMKGNLENVSSYIRLSRIRCSGDAFVDFIGQKFDPTWSVTEAKKHMLHLFENPEKNIKLDEQQTIDNHKLETIEINQYTHKLKEACDNFNNGNYKKCLDLFKEGLDLVKRSKIQIDANTDQGIKFISALAHVNIGSVASFKTALDIYTSTIGVKKLREEKDITEAGQADKVPMAMLGLAMLLEKLFRFKLGAKVVERGLVILEKKGKKLNKYTWPGSEVELPYCTLAYMKDQFEILKHKFTFPPTATAVCRYAKCFDHQNMPCRDIYLGEPEFAGYVTIGCEASCTVSYHYVCWKDFKETITPVHRSGSKINDKDILGTVCPTEDCYKICNDEKIPNKIIEYTIYDKDGKLKTSKKMEYTPEPEYVPAPPPPQPKKKKKKPIPAAVEPNASSLRTTSTAAKGTPTKVNRGNLWVAKMGSAEPDENIIIKNIVKQKLPMLRERIGILPTLLEVTKNVNVTATMQKQLWYLSVRDWVTNNQGVMKKEELHNLFSDDLRAVTDYKKMYYNSDERKGVVSRTEFFGHLLTSDEFGCVDDCVCFTGKVQETSDYVANEFQDLYGKLFKLKFEPKEKSKTMSPVPMASGIQERRDSLIRERRDSERERKDSDRQRRDSLLDSNRERRDSLRERRNSSSHSDINSITKIANDEDSNSGVSTPEPTKMQNDVATQMQPEQVVSTAQFLESEFETLNDAPVYSPQSVAAVPEVTSESRNSIDRETIPETNEEIQLNLAAAIAYNQQDEANIKIAELERQLSEAKVKCLDTEQLLENYQRDAHMNTLEIDKIRDDYKEKEKKLNEKIQTLTSDKAKETRAKVELQKRNDELKKELTETKKKVDSAETAKAKKKKQDEISAGAIQKLIHHINKHWEFIHQIYQKEKAEKEALVYELLEYMHECTNEQTYTEVLQYIQKMEDVISGVEDHGRRLKDRLASVKDAHKNPEQHWPTLSKIDLPQLPNMPDSVILRVVTECVKKYATLLKSRAQAGAAAPVEVVHRQTPPPSQSIFEQVPQNVARRQESPGPSALEEMGACALPARSLLPPRLENRKGTMMSFHVPPPFPNLHHEFNPAAPAASTSYQTAPTPLLPNFPPDFRIAPPAYTPAHAPPPSQPMFQAPQPRPVAAEPQRQPKRDLLPSSVIHHVNLVSRQTTRGPTMADSFKKPNAPQIHAMRATRIPASELQIPAYIGFAELEQELFMLSKLIPHTSQNDLRQALHWLCQRRSSAEVRSLEPEAMQNELCSILTEMLMTASAEEINEEESEVVKSVTERPSLDCSICIESFRNDNKGIHQLSCGHLFHKPCIRNWLEMGDNKGCPVCRGITITSSPNHHFPPLHGGRR